MTGISGALAGIHLGIAMLTQQPHWNIDEQEAEAMAKAVANVARHYPKVAGSQKLIDWTMLIGALGMAYVPRAMMTRDIMRAKADEKKRNAANG